MALRRAASTAHPGELFFEASRKYFLKPPA
jgi:hypothetical protein